MLYSLRQLARRAHMDYRTIKRAIEAGELPAARFRSPRGSIRYRVSDAVWQAWIAGQLVVPLPTAVASNPGEHPWTKYLYKPSAPGYVPTTKP